MSTFQIVVATFNYIFMSCKSSIFHLLPALKKKPTLNGGKKLKRKRYNWHDGFVMVTTHAIAVNIGLPQH